MFPLKEKPNSIFDVFKGGSGRQEKAKPRTVFIGSPVCAEEKMPGAGYNYICIGMSRRARVRSKCSTLANTWMLP